MQIRQRLLSVLLCMLVLLAGASSRSWAADGSTVTLGSGLSLGILIPDEGDNVTIFSAPEGNQLFATAPGLRLGLVSPSRGFEFGLDTSVLFASSEGDDFHVLVIGVDAQKHFVGQSSWNLFLGGEFGISTSEFIVDTTQPYVGVMIGGRNVISDGNGSVKLALHLRHHLEDEDAFADSFSEVALAMHFDLWIP